MVLFLSLGCSGHSTGPNPVVPDESSDIQLSENRSGNTNRFLLGYYNIGIDPDSLEAEIFPLRETSIHLNILNLLEKAPCTNCVKVKGLSGTPNNTILVSLEFTHPLNNPVFTVFDVRGIIMTIGSRWFPASGLLTSDLFLGNSELVNADGHTTLYNVTTFGQSQGGFQEYIHGKLATQMYPDTTLNGFMRHATSGSGNLRNALYAGNAVTSEYEIYKPAGYFVLGYAVDASWALPYNNPVTDPQTDFPMEANCPEPWKLDANQNPVGLGLTSSGGETVLTVDVYDYQGKLSHYVPYVECPELWDGQKSTSYKSTGDGYATFEITVSNEKLAGDGFYQCLIGVRDVEDNTSPDYLDLTAYKIVRLPVGFAIPPNVEVFNASDADPTLYDRKVELTWEALESELVEWYDIERLDFSTDSGGWVWVPVKSAPQGVDNWIDPNPRYSGPENPIHYRIWTSNEAGKSLGYAEDTGYPKLRNVGMALWCVAEDASGSGAVYSWATATKDFNDCNTFWNRYGVNFILENPTGFLWVGNPEYIQINGGEAVDMHDGHGKAQTPHSISNYYVGSVDGNSHKAYCNAYCPGIYHNTENIFIIMGKDARGAGAEEMPVILAHECGHAMGHFWDVYLLDTNKNLILDDGTSCQANNTWCNTPPEIPVLFCDINACYAQNPGAHATNPWNLMWYSCPGKAIGNYNLTDRQAAYAGLWLQEFKNNYPFP